jgi:fatty-acyl-CoA synthase
VSAHRPPGHDGSLPGDHPFVRDLAKNAANHVPLTPLSFLARTASTWPSRVAVRHGEQAFTWRAFEARCRRLASALARRGVRRGDTVAVLAPNGPPMLEAHYAVPGLGAILNALNYRLDARGIAFCLAHGEAKVLLCDAELAAVARDALGMLDRRILVVDLADPEGPGAEPVGELTYHALLAEGDPAFAWPGPLDEWDSLALLYTSGTTGDPKGVVYHHRGAYLNALGNALAMRLSPDSVYLWTLPMFHCNGWTFTWAVTAAGGTHVCLRKVDPAQVFGAIRNHKVTHLCGAPIVLNMLANAPASARVAFDHGVAVATGGAAPPSPVIAAMESMGFRATHLYGLTESYGPATICEPQDEWATLDLPARAREMARQGVAMPTLEGVRIGDPATSAPLPADGATLGEVLLRGNTIMKGYLKNPRATDAAFAQGWYHSGDLGVMHPDGYVEIKDRAKDVIISGGENVSSLEVEECLYRHPGVLEAAVVARPDPRWGETPCAFVTLKEGVRDVDAAAIVAWCREHLAHFKAPRTVVFGPLPKTSTGKIQKFVLRERARALPDA